MLTIGAWVEIVETKFTTHNLKGCRGQISKLYPHGWYGVALLEDELPRNRAGLIDVRGIRLSWNLTAVLCEQELKVIDS